MAEVLAEAHHSVSAAEVSAAAEPLEAGDCSFEKTSKRGGIAEKYDTAPNLNFHNPVCLRNRLNYGS